MSRQHVVKKGENLWAIAVAYTNYGPNYRALLKLNDIPYERQNHINPGQVLYIPFDWPWLEEKNND